VIQCSKTKIDGAKCDACDCGTNLVYNVAFTQHITVAADGTPIYRTTHIWLCGDCRRKALKALAEPYSGEVDKP